MTSPPHPFAAHAGAAPTSAVSIRDDVDVTAIDASAWDRLAGDAPLASHAFLAALHGTGVASAATGWRPHYLTAWRDGALAGAMPLYAKAHSYGEYVFDWAWADAYRRHRRRYYPKLRVRDTVHAGDADRACSPPTTACATRCWRARWP